MSRHGFAHRLSVHAATAAETIPAFGEKRIFPHLLRHRCALPTLEATGDIRRFSLWLGHASIQSTEIYLRSDLVGKLKILGETVPPSIARGTFMEAADRVMEFLQEARVPQ